MSNQFDEHNQYYQPTAHATLPTHGAPQPPKNRTPVIIAFTAAGLALIIAIAAVALALFKSNSSDDDAAATAQTPAAQAQTAETQAAPQTVTQTQTVAPPPDARAAAQRAGYVYACDNSSVLRSSTSTTCDWARKVQGEVLRRGPFNDVPIFSAFTNSYVPTTCWNEQDYYVCRGQNHPFAVLR